MSGRLIYVIGPSGSGKDSLLRYARDRLAGEAHVVFAHRYITRAADAGGENHIELTRVEFATRLRSGLFALAWESHGHAYALGIEIEQWLALGATVVVNGSRGHLGEAGQRFPELQPVSIDVPANVLRERLMARGREGPAAIEQRLERHQALQRHPPAGLVIANDGPLERAGEALLEFVRIGAEPPSCA
jgi:ribose 1,5-bisphosphokinase